MTTTPILELLIILILLWLWSGGFNATRIEIPNETELDYRLIARLQRDLTLLLSEYHNIPKYELIPSYNNRTFVTNKERIYLVLRHPVTGVTFDYSTLLRATLHEISHVICETPGHHSEFYRLEEYLITLAVNHDLLPSNFIPNPDYPCQDDDNESYYS